MRAPKFYKIVFLTSVSHFIPLLSQPYFSVCTVFIFLETIWSFPLRPTTW